MAEAEDTHSFAGEFVTHELALFPKTGTGGFVSGHNVAGGGKHHGDDLFGDSVGVGTGGVHHVDVFLAGVLDVDGVETGSGADDEFEFGEHVNQFGSDFFTPHDDHFGIGVGLEKVSNGSCRIEDAVVVPFNQPVSCELVEFSRNQNLAHGKLPPYKKRFCIIYSQKELFSNRFILRSGLFPQRLSPGVVRDKYLLPQLFAFAAVCAVGGAGAGEGVMSGDTGVVNVTL